MQIFDWYSYCFKNYFKLDGRAGRAEFWSFSLINLAVWLVLIYLFGSFQYDTYQTQQAMSLMTVSTFGIHYMGMPATIYFCIVFIPNIAVTVRRLHDRDHTGWWAFWGWLIGILNIVVLIFCALPSMGPNRYGLRAPAYPGDEVPPFNPNAGYGNYASPYSASSYRQEQEPEPMPQPSRRSAQAQARTAPSSSGVEEAEIVRNPHQQYSDRPDHPNVYEEFNSEESNSRNGFEEFGRDGAAPQTDRRPASRPGTRATYRDAERYQRRDRTQTSAPEQEAEQKDDLVSKLRKMANNGK